MAVISQERMDEAAAFYRRILELRPRDVLAMNNLATVLAEQPDGLSEGKELVAKAIDLAGPLAGLLDVKGVLLVAEGKPDQAVPVLEEASAASQADPRYCFSSGGSVLAHGKSGKSPRSLRTCPSIKTGSANPHAGR